VKRRRLTLPQRVALAGEILVVYVRVRWLMRRRPVQDIVATLRRGQPGATGPAGGSTGRAPTGRRQRPTAL
jgi:hypothetical protein